jgi:hypothetical protein
MAERRRRIVRWLLVRLIIFAAGFAAGFYVRDQRYQDLQERYERAAAELEALQESAEDVIDRGRRAGESLREGAEAAAETMEAAEELTGRREN